jgi:hypothetical protein
MNTDELEPLLTPKKLKPDPAYVAPAEIVAEVAEV